MNPYLERVQCEYFVRVCDSLEFLDQFVRRSGVRDVGLVIRDVRIVL